jgi:hypothetical protein
MLSWSFRLCPSGISLFHEELFEVDGCLTNKLKAWNFIESGSCRVNLVSYLSHFFISLFNMVPREFGQNQLKKKILSQPKRSALF